MLGFGLLIWGSQAGDLTLLMFASAIEVTGFALMTPSLQSLISRRSDPEKTGRHPRREPKHQLAGPASWVR